MTKLDGAKEPNVRDAVYFYKQKLAKARKECADFETGLAEMMCGDNEFFLYRSSSKITDFFQNLRFDYAHDGSTRRHWVAEVLKKLDIDQIYKAIEQGLFRKRDLIEQANFKEISTEKCIAEAKEHFKAFINECIEFNHSVDIGDAFGLNVNTELLFEKELNSNDATLNQLIKSAKDYFQKGSEEYRQTGLEKLWDAFERIKTYYDNNKNVSIKELIDNLPSPLDNDFYDKEFKNLTHVGNDYAIRHHEKDKPKISNPDLINYLFFRMLSLIDLCLNSIENHTTQKASQNP